MGFMKRIAATWMACLITMTITAFQQPAKPKKIIFFGDSITEMGARDNGYIVQATRMLHTPGNYALMGAGIGGNKVYDLYLRLDKDVLEKKPDAVFIYIGVNDVWHKALTHTGTDADKFRRFYQAIIDKLMQASIKPVLCTPAVIGEKQRGGNTMDKELDLYADIIRSLAGENQCPLVDLRNLFMNYYALNNAGNIDKGLLTTDGVHLNDKGNELVAGAMLECLAKLNW